MCAEVKLDPWPLEAHLDKQAIKGQQRVSRSKTLGEDMNKKLLYAVLAVFVCGSTGTVQPQSVERTVLLPDSIRGPGFAMPLAYNSRNQKVYLGGPSGVLIIDLNTLEKIGYIRLRPEGVSAFCTRMVYDSICNRVYFANGATEEIVVIDGDSNEMISALPFTGLPSDLIWNMDDRVYCSVRNYDQVLIVDTFEDSLIKVLEVGTRPIELLFIPTHNKVYCSNYGSGDISVIDEQADTIITRIQVGHAPCGLVLSPTNKVYCSCRSQLAIIDATVDTMIGVLPVSGSSMELVCTPENRIYCPDMSGEIVVIDGFADTILARIPVGGYEISSMVYDRHNEQIFAAFCDSLRFYLNLVVIDARTDTILTTLVLEEASPSDLLLASGKVFASDAPSNNITVVNTSSCRVEGRIWTRFWIGFGWRQMVFGESKLYCRSYDSDAIAILEPADEIVSLVPTGVLPVDLVWNGIDRKLYCANWYSDDLTVIDGVGDSVLTTIPLRDFPFFTYPGPLAWNAKQNKIYCAKTYRSVKPGEIVILDGATDSIIRIVEVGIYPFSLVWNSLQDKIYCANWGFHVSDSTLTVIDGATDRAIDTIVVGIKPQSLLWTERTNKIYCSVHGDYEDRGKVAVIDCWGDSVVAKITVNHPLYHSFPFTYNRTDNKIYHSSFYAEEGVVAVIDGWADTILTQLDMGGVPRHTVWDSVNNWIWCVIHTGNLVLIDGKGDTVITTISVGEEPHFLLPDLEHQRIYVAVTEGDIVVMHFSSPGIKDWYTLASSEKPRMLELWLNPCEVPVVIKFSVLKRSCVTLRLYNLTGQLVRTLVNEVKERGCYAIHWDGKTGVGRRVPSGTYFLRLEAGQYSATRKLCVVR